MKDPNPSACIKVSFWSFVNKTTTSSDLDSLPKSITFEPKNGVWK